MASQNRKTPRVAAAYWLVTASWVVAVAPACFHLAVLAARWVSHSLLLTSLPAASLVVAT